MKVALPKLPEPAPTYNAPQLRALFRNHLVHEGYTELTADKSAAALPNLLTLAHGSMPGLPRSFRIPAIRALRWLRTGLVPQQLPPNEKSHLVLKLWLEKILVDEEVDDPPEPKTLRHTLSKLSPSQWVKLQNYVEEHAEESTEALIVLVAMTSPLRIGKILDMPLDLLRDSIRNDTVRERLMRFLKGRHRTLTEAYGSVSSHSAYGRLRRYVSQVSRELGFEFDFNSIARSRQMLPK